jgi:hypothetical protein
MTAVIGWIGSVLCVSSILQKNQLRFRALNLAACIAMITFNVANATWSMVALNVVVAAINIRQITILRRAESAPVTSPAPAAVTADTSEIDEARRELVAA